jgi:acetylornithine/N-succinyldiaminopimelate aminotransferase
MHYIWNRSHRVASRHMPHRLIECFKEWEKEQLEKLKEQHSVIKDVRGVGLLLGMKLKIPGAPVVDQCMKRGFLINCIQEKILRFIPPLIIEKEDIDSLIACLDEIFSKGL